MAAEPTKAISVFSSYAQEDVGLLDELDKHLSAMERLKKIVGWDNRDVQAGAERDKENEEHLNAAQIILLLISPDFMNSDDCYNEMRRALELHENGQTCVIPIILRPFQIKDAPFSQLKILPTDGRAVTVWHNRDEAFADVARGIEEVVEKLLSKTKEQWFVEGLAHHKARRYEQALKAYEQIIQLDPDYARAYRSKGDVFFDLHRYEEALDLYQRAIRLDPNHARIHRNIGDILSRLKQYDKALAAYEEAIRIELQSAPLYNDKGKLLYGLGRYEEALVAFESATVLDSHFADAYNNKGSALSRLNRYIEALSAYEQAIRLSPNFALAHNNKGRALHHLRRYKEALAAFEEAVRLNPQFRGAYNNMADTLEQLGRREEARVTRARVQ